ncbi:hypothetical protein ACROYT_G042370 [Oculina patagonica]
MEHKIDQIMAMIGAQSNAALKMENQLNPSMMGNQSNAAVIGGNQSNAAVTGNQFNAARVGSQSNASVIGNQFNSGIIGNQSNSTMIRNQSNATLVVNQLNEGNQSNATMTGNQSNTPATADDANTTANVPQSNPTAMETQSSAFTMESQSNASLAETHLNGTTTKNKGDADTVMELPSAETAKTIISSNTSSVRPGMSTTQGRVLQRKMAKITENTLPEDLNFPISRDNIIAMQAKSTSTMNFAVRLMRELFTLEELEGKNISGARGKDRVDPNRVEIIKDIVFKVYRTSPSDRDLVWRCCRKAMDSFMRRMKRDRALKNKLAADKND